MNVIPTRSPGRGAVGPWSAWTLVAAGLGAAAWAVSSPVAAETQRDWSRVQLAQNDPRAVSDAPLPVDPVPARRLSRRAQRRTVRRGVPEAAVPASRGPEPRGRDSLSVPPDAPGVPPPAGRSVAPPFETEPMPRGPLEDGVTVTRLDPQPDRPAPDVAVRVVLHRDQPSVEGGHPRQRFDIRLPDGCSGGGLPLVVWIHGPDWRTGSKSECPVTWLVGRGYAVASIGYRTSDVAVFPAQLDDCRAAVARIVADAEVWGIDPTRICVAGSGAGGHLAALVGFAAHATGPVRAASTDGDHDDDAVPAAVVVVDAPVHLTSLGPTADRAGSAASRLVGGPLPELREAAQQASPLVHVSADDPPTLIVSGGRTSGVPADQATRLDQALETAGVDSTLVIIDHGGHAPPLGEGSPAGAALAAFLERVIGPGAPRSPGK